MSWTFKWTAHVLMDIARKMAHLHAARSKSFATSSMRMTTSSLGSSANVHSSICMTPSLWSRSTCQHKHAAGTLLQLKVC